MLKRAARVMACSSLLFWLIAGVGSAGVAGCGVFHFWGTFTRVTFRLSSNPTMMMMGWVRVDRMLCID
jgi:hypothetical protein